MKKKILLVFSFLFIVFLLNAQTPSPITSSGEQLLVLNISNYGYDISSESFGFFTSEILSSFSSFGRYSLKSANYSVSAEDSQALIDRISNKGGQELTETEKKLFNGYSFLVIPSIDDYSSNPIDSMTEVEIYLSLLFVNLDTGEVIDKLLLHSYGVGENDIEADKEAAREIGKQLFYELGRLNQFKFETFVVEVIGSDVIIESSSNTNVSVGDEFFIIGSNFLPKENKNNSKAGLIVVTSKRNNTLFGHIVYSDKPVTPGCGLMKKSSLGIELLPYGRAFLNEKSSAIGSGGLRLVLTKWVYHFRPFLAMEIPVPAEGFTDNWTGFPVSISAGSEFSWNIQRLQIKPSLGVGFTGLLPTNEDESFLVSHIGFSTDLSLQWLLFDSFKICLEGGYNHWAKMPMENNTIKNYGGIFIGVAVAFKS